MIVALENGPLTDEKQQVFAFNPSQGEIEKVAFKNVDAIIWNNKTMKGDGTFYSYRNNVMITSNYVSFMGQESKLLQTMYALQGPFSQWTSFDGFAIHELSRDKF